MKNCSNCFGSLFPYKDEETGFTEFICWKCGQYESNSPAFKQNPQMFKNLFRDNPFQFFKKIQKSTENLHGEDPTDDFTMPYHSTILISSFYKLYIV